MPINISDFSPSGPGEQTLGTKTVPWGRIFAENASAAAAGLMSAEDKEKLDNLGTAIAELPDALKKYVVDAIEAIEIPEPSPSGSGRHLAEPFFHPDPDPPVGSIRARGELFSRELYPDLWAEVERISARNIELGLQPLIVTDSEWQTAATAQAGYCSRYSTGDGEHTFRVPFYGRVFAAATTDAEINRWVTDQMRPITGTGFALTQSAPSGAVYQAATGTVPGAGGSMGVGGVDSALLGPNYDGPETTPKAVFLPVYIQAYHSVVNQGVVDMQAWLEALNGKLDKSAFEVSQQVLHVRDEKPSNTHGGTFTAGAWRTRDLNTVVMNTIPGASLTNNRIILPAGSYEVRADVAAEVVGSHQARLYNRTTPDNSLLGHNINTTYGSAGYNSCPSFVVGIISITQTSEYEVQHICELTYSNHGMGKTNLSTWGVNTIYTTVFIRRLS